VRTGKSSQELLKNDAADSRQPAALTRGQGRHTVAFALAQPGVPKSWNALPERQSLAEVLSSFYTQISELYP
jgi:hypothetical protein